MLMFRHERSFNGIVAEFYQRCFGVELKESTVNVVLT